MTLDQLAEAFATADDELTGALAAECKRRDRSDRARQARRSDPAAAEWRDMAHAQFVAAEAATNGYMLNRRGVAHAIDPWSLWSGPATRAMAYASWELQEFWSANPRLTVSEYRRQLAAGERIQDDERDREAATIPGARELADLVRAEGPEVLDRYPAEFLAELLDAEHAAQWLGIATKTIYVDTSRGRWPDADMTLGRSRAWTRRTLVLHLAARAGRGAPGRPRTRTRTA